SLDHIPLPIIGDAIDRQCDSVAANIRLDGMKPYKIERWIKLLRRSMRRAAGKPVAKLSREMRCASRDARRWAKCAVLDGGGFIRQSERISEPWSCLGHRSSRDRNHNGNNGKRAGR